MNALELLRQKSIDPSKLAFHVPGGNLWTFGDLHSLSASAQTGLRSLGIKTGDTVLLADDISVELYAAAMAILGIGAALILVEPYLPVSEIDRIIHKNKPKLFLSSMLGKFWGARVPSIRSIPRWSSCKSLCSFHSSEAFKVESLDPDTPGILTFTSGTTGLSKSVIRTHSTLISQNKTIEDAARLKSFSGPDLAIFANLVFANLAMGRGSIFIDSKWKIKALQKIQSLSTELQPQTLSCGPGFLRYILKNPEISIPSLKSIHVGGAQTDCSIFQNAFRKWSQARFIHVYGSSEAEPVAISDARVAVKKSLDRGYFQTLFVGSPIPHLSTRFETSKDHEGLWVKGSHVGKEWHFMGDRILSDEQGWWYQGRSQQPYEDFKTEQEIYSLIESSACFIHDGSMLVGERIKAFENNIRSRFPKIKKIVELKMIRDRRHRARIDRIKTLKSGGLI